MLLVFLQWILVNQLIDRKASKLHLLLRLDYLPLDILDAYLKLAINFDKKRFYPFALSHPILERLLPSILSF